MSSRQTRFYELKHAFRPTTKLCPRRSIMCQLVCRIHPGNMGDWTEPSADCRSVENATGTALRISVSACWCTDFPSVTAIRHLKRKATPSLSHFVLFRVDAAWPRLGRAFRTAPVSRQTNPNRRLALTALSLTPCHPPSASVLSLSPFRLVSSRCRSSEERNKPETAEREKT